MMVWVEMGLCQGGVPAVGWDYPSHRLFTLRPRLGGGCLLTATEELETSHGCTASLVNQDLFELSNNGTEARNTLELVISCSSTVRRCLEKYVQPDYR